jgi:antitoxin HicB
MSTSNASRRNQMSDVLYPIFVRPLSEEEGGGYLAFAPDLQGCFGDGESPEDAVADLRRAIDEWCDEARRLGRKIPQPCSSLSKALAEKKELLSLIKAQNELIEAQDKIVQSAQAEVDEIKQRLAGLESQEDCDFDATIAWSRHGAALLGLRGGKRRKMDDFAH